MRSAQEFCCRPSLVTPKPVTFASHCHPTGAQWGKGMVQKGYRPAATTLVNLSYLLEEEYTSVKTHGELGQGYEYVE